MATTSEVRLILNAVDNASKQINGVSQSLTGMHKVTKTAGDFLGGLGIQFGEITNPAMLAGQMVGKFADYAKRAIADTAAYAKTVDDFSRALGTGAAEASALIEIAGDLEIETGTLKTAMRTALKDGVSPTIDGLKDLAKEYQALQTPTEKAQFALQKFGRAGLEMQKFLELAPEQIDEMAKSAERAGLIMDEEAVQAAEDYRVAMMNLEDASESLKRSLGNQLIPVVTDVVNAMNATVDRSNLARSLTETAEKAGIASFELQKMRSNLSQQEYINRLTPIVEDYNREIDKFNNMQRDAARVTGELTDALGDEEGAMSDVVPAMQDVLLTNAEILKNLDDSIYKFQTKMGGMETFYSRQADRARELERQTERNEEGAERVGTKIVAGAGLAQDAVRKLIDEMGRIPTTIDANININVTGNGAAYVTGTQTNGSVGTGANVQEARATGGPVIAGRPYLVGEQGPEMFVPGQSGRVVDARTTQTIINRAAPDVSIYMQASDPELMARQVANQLARRM